MGEMRRAIAREEQDRQKKTALHPLSSSRLRSSPQSGSVATGPAFREAMEAQALPHSCRLVL